MPGRSKLWGSPHSPSAPAMLALEALTGAPFLPIPGPGSGCSRDLSGCHPSPLRSPKASSSVIAGGRLSKTFHLLLPPELLRASSALQQVEHPSLTPAVSILLCILLYVCVQPNLKRPVYQTRLFPWFSI